MNVIYRPSGRAGEYCEYAINIYLFCNHNCQYCYCPKFLHMKPEDFFKPDFCARKGLLPALEKQLATGEYAGKLIHLTFVGDPYPAPPVDTAPTREVIKLLKAAGCHVQILTKGGWRAEKDFDLLDAGDWFGITLSGDESKEPNAASENERLISLEKAHIIGVNTWVSFEPVYTPAEVYEALAAAEFIDLYRIGKLNYYPSNINWGEFGRECERLAAQYGRRIYIKADLRAAMQEGL
jgi:DNA repair photolyase